MGKTCSTYGEDEKCIQNSGGKGDLGVDRRTTLKWSY